MESLEKEVEINQSILRASKVLLISGKGGGG